MKRFIDWLAWSTNGRRTAVYFDFIGAIFWKVAQILAPIALVIYIIR